VTRRAPLTAAMVLAQKFVFVHAHSALPPDLKKL
jgi:hypothetical protein